MSLVPANLREECGEAATTKEGQLATLWCRSHASDRPAWIYYSLFDSNASAEANYNEWTDGGLERGSCRQEWNVQDRWTYRGGDYGGILGCYRTQEDVVIIWTQKSENLLVAAGSPDMSQQELHDWWLEQPVL